MPDLSIIGDNTVLIGVLVVGGFCAWKFIIEPLMNEGQPIEPPKDYKTFQEKMQESLNTECNI